MNITIKTPISYYGGKQAMLKTILPLIPKHKTYCEPFFGGGAVFWAKEPSKLEYINDFNTMVVNFYEQLKSNFEELKDKITATLYSRSVQKMAINIYENPHLFTPVMRAWAFWVVTNFGFNNEIESFGTCPKNPATRFNKRQNFTAELSQRLDKVFIENMDAVKLIERIDKEDVFFYIDPPYVGANQGHYGGYEQEHFERLLETLSKIKGKFMLSSYPNEALTKYAQKCGWRIENIDLNLSASPSKKRKIECITMNY